MSQDLEKAPAVEETEFGGPSGAQQRKVIHFANGDTLEQDSSDEEEEEEEARKEPFSAPNKALTSWRKRSWYLCVMTGVKFLKTCDFIGEKLANLAGLNMAKYQYAIDQFNRDKSQEKKCATRSQGSKRQAVDGARQVEEEAETIQLSSKKSAEYGATEWPQAPGPRASPDGAEQSQRPAGSQNQGYQED